MFLEGLNGKLFVNFKAGIYLRKRGNLGHSLCYWTTFESIFQAKQSKWIIMVGKPLQSHLPTIILMVLTGLCNTDWSLLPNPFTGAKQTQHLKELERLRSHWVLKRVSTEQLGKRTKCLRKKKSILKNNDSKEKASSSKRGIRAAANIQSVCICHRTFESICVKFRLKHN